MRIYCDGSIKNGIAAIGVVIVDHNIILHREGYRVLADTSSKAEQEALKQALRLTYKFPADAIYTDYSDIGPYETWMPTFTGSLKWISRQKNQIAHGMAYLAVEGFDWEREIVEGSKLIVTDTLTPMNWNVKKGVGDICNTVHIHKKKFYCDCDNFDLLSKCKFSCRHIWAVKKKINIVNSHGEGMF